MKKYLSHLAAIAVFALLTLVYFNPLLSGKVLKQGDVINFKGMVKEVQDFREQNNDEPLWTNSMFGGMPAYQISTKYPANWVRPLIPFTALGIPHPACIIFLCMLGFYLLLLSLKVDPLWAAAGAIGFALSSYFFQLIEAGHNPKGYAIAYMAPFVMGLLMAYRGRMWLGAAIAAVSLSLELSSNHLQITYYLAMLSLILILGEFFVALTQKQIAQFLKVSAVLLVAALLALGPNITNILITEEYGKYSTRGKSELTDNKENKTTGLDRDYATQWSYGVGETFSLMIPNFKGGQSQMIGSNKDALKDVDPNFREYVGNTDQYWGEQPFTSGPFYMGAITCFLFLLGMLILEDKMKWYLLAAAILGIMLSWGKNFMGLTNFFMDYIPGYNKFRAVSMIMVLANFTIPLLAVLCIQRLSIEPALIKNKRKQFYIALGATAGLCLVFYIMPGAFQDFFKEGEYDNYVSQLKKGGATEDQISTFISGVETARIAVFKSDAIRSFLFIALTGLVLLIYSAGKISKQVLYTLTGLLILIDLWAVDQRYLSRENFVSKGLMEQPFTPTAADEQILEDKDPNYRVANFSVSTFNDASTSYFHKSIGGYHGAKLKRYQELIEFQISKNNMEVLNMLNTRYFIVQDKNTQAPAVQKNPFALGNAWFVKSWKVVQNSDQEIKALDSLKPAKEAVLDKRYADMIGKPVFDSLGSIHLDSYKPNHLVYTYSASSPQFTVFSEIFYDKGWNAYIDGQLTPHFRTNYVLRGMILPAGNNKKVEFKFEPETYYKGEKIALAGSILLFLFIAAGIFLDRRQRVKKEA